MLTAAIAFSTCFSGGAVTRAAFRMAGSGAVSGACSGPTPTGMGAGSWGPGRPSSLTWIRNAFIAPNHKQLHE